MANGEPQPGPSEPTRGRRRGRSHHARPELPEQRPFAQPRLRHAPTELLDEEQIERIHTASLRILAELGMRVLDPETRAIFAEAGATIGGRGGHSDEMVRFDPELVTELIATAPEQFTLHARNPAHDLVMGGDHLSFGSVGSAPNVADLDRGRRTGNRADFQDLLRLVQSLNSIHLTTGYPVEPVDVHGSVRHLDTSFDLLTLTDKAIHVYSLGRQRNLDAIEMVRIARGATDEQLDREPSIFTIINTNSPLTLDVPMGHGIIEMSRRNQIVCVTPFTLAGAMAPITLAGALSQQNAEALVGLMLTQIVRPGSPFIYGGFTSNVDMQSGAPAFGTPEYWKTAIIGGQLARRYGVPYRSSNVCAANAVDAQAAYESMIAISGAVAGRCNLMMHAAGWMEGGLQASFEKMVLDADLLHMTSAALDPVVVDDDTLAFDAIAEVGPGGHFFGTDHTQARFRTEFYRPLISDWRNYETWEEAGKPEAVQKANQLVKAFLAAYEPPPIDDAVRDELADFVARRTSEGGVPVDY
ncbi:MAG: trimethylamine methyltransferase family protein [Ilumatobacter sp.]|nr:trimethylamine methyltransferase family protein [Ilumatobacter sp.]